MLLHTLQLQNFRNYKNTKVTIDQTPINFLIGENGQGKTNFLEALYYLSFGGSFKTKKEEQVVSHYEKFYRIYAEFKEEKIFHSIEITYQKQKKTIKIDNKIIKERKHLLQYFPCIIFKHSDVFYVSGGPNQQRLYLDQLLVLGNPNYTVFLQQYNRLLTQKNKALKESQHSLLSVYNEQLAQVGLTIIGYRIMAIQYINAHLSMLFSRIYGQQAEVSLQYFPSWNVFTDQERKELFFESCLEKGDILQNYLPRVIKKQEQQREKEIFFKYSTTGPHRDVIKILLDNHEFKQVGSTGQIRILSLVLRYIQAQYHFDKKESSMIYLFDDVLLEIDTQKQKRFLSALPQTKQAFFTFLPEETLPHIIETQEKKFFYIKQGTISETKEQHTQEQP